MKFQYQYLYLDPDPFGTTGVKPTIDVCVWENVLTLRQFKSYLLFFLKKRNFVIQILRTA
jgi:hypothetical protein